VDVSASVNVATVLGVGVSVGGGGGEDEIDNSAITTRIIRIIRTIVP